MKHLSNVTHLITYCGPWFEQRLVRTPFYLFGIKNGRFCGVSIILLWKPSCLMFLQSPALLYPLNALLHSILQAFSATVGQIHTWLQHLQLCRGLARCHQDEPVQRQLPQLRLYFPAAGGSNDLRVSSPARHKWRVPSPYGTQWAHLYEMRQHRVCVFLAWTCLVTATLNDCIKVKPVWNENHEHLTPYHRLNIMITTSISWKTEESIM